MTSIDGMIFTLNGLLTVFGAGLLAGVLARIIGLSSGGR